MNRMLFTFTLFVALMAEGNIASASILIVGDGGYNAIQDAIDAAVDGDEIIVTTGTYYENIEFNGKNIIVRSTDPLNQDVVINTIIDGQGLSPVVTFSGDEGTSCVLSGLTLRNGLGHEVQFITGNGTIIEYWGAGVFGNRTQAQVEYCIIKENMGHEGLAIWRGGSLLNNRIEENIKLAPNDSYGVGSAIITCVGEIAYNRIDNNYLSYGIANCGYDLNHNLIEKCRTGMGIIYGSVCSNIVAHCQGNGISSVEGYLGVPDKYPQASGEIFENVVLLSGEHGVANSDVPVVNNIICFNNLEGNTSYGGGIYDCDGMISHNLVAYNYASKSYGVGGIFGCYGEIINNIIWSNYNSNGLSQINLYATTPTFCIIEGSTYGDDTNSTATPLFADPWALDFRLLPGSPGIDGGTSAGVTVDFIGNARPQDGDGLGAGSTGDGLDFDIGPYETTTSDRIAAMRGYILGQPTTDTLTGSPWPAEWPEEWIAELQAIELPTTAVAMLTSYSLQAGAVSTTASLDVNNDGRLDVADIVLAVTGGGSSPVAPKNLSALDSRTISSAKQPYATRWRPPVAKPMPPRRPFPIESYRARYGKYAEAMWKLDNTPHPGNGPIIVDLREYE